KRGHVVTIGNEKGGSGKSTTAMHICIGLMRGGRSVASIDLDVRQQSLTRYVENRQAYAATHGHNLPMPEHQSFAVAASEIGRSENADEERIVGVIERLRDSHDVIVIDTPGSDNPLNRMAHSLADVLVTPLNDSLVDLDVLARVDGARMKVLGPSHYSEMIWEQKMRRAQRDGGSIDWIVMRNRLSNLDAYNKRDMDKLIKDLAGRINFRVMIGFGERVIFRELFLAGLTIMDLKEAAGQQALSPSHLAARAEVQTLVNAIDLPPLR
ncbi:MAG: division plane positioning ATPase MipZ, partial [Rhodospirillales bacterium]